MSKQKKINKEYLLTDNTVNCYGFRLLTEGYQMDLYQKNPIGYHMHFREEGVLVRWEDLRVDGDKVYGKPVINLSNPRGQQTVDEIENGFLNAASVGKIVVLELSTDPKDMLPGQEGPTATKWYNRECSLVDIPGNYNALTELYDKDLNAINLADFTKPTPRMEKPVFTAAQIAALDLSADATEQAIGKAFNDLVAKAKKADTLEQEMKDLKASANKAQVTQFLDLALSEKRITKELHDKLAVQYAERPEELKDLLAAMPKYTSVTGEIAKGAEGDKFKELKDKTWDELSATGELPALKAGDFELFKQKFKDKFKKEYSN